MRAFPLLIAVVGAAVACGSPTVIKATCVDLKPQELNETASCLGPPVTDAAVQACAVGALPTGDEVPVCLVSPDSRIFRALITPSASVRGTGWTHSAYGSNSGTTTPADVSRCSRALPADAASLSACP